ncbi:hypothetical protein, partial [Pseudomonas helleri]|uniref:hypothetical protein n=1 Tax=Pseudomonas helleri TaxID=1608996 RepID=UPI001E542372
RPINTPINLRFGVWEVLYQQDFPNTPFLLFIVGSQLPCRAPVDLYRVYATSMLKSGFEHEKKLSGFWRADRPGLARLR